MIKPRLTDFMDPNRPLAKAAMDLDWTTVVALFPEAHLDGCDAARIWVLASILILVEISGLSEGEVLSRWPENPYWQAFSGFAQFQWKAPVNQADCLAFRRYVDAPRAARLSAIAQSILQAKPLEATALESVNVSPASTVDDVLALRQVHFLQPALPQPFKAPPRADLQKGIMQAYAKAAAPSGSPGVASPSPRTHESNDYGGAEPGAAAQTAQTDKTNNPDQVEVAVPTTTQGASIEEVPPATIPEKPVVPQFAQTYTMLVKRSASVGIRPQSSSLDGLVSPETPPPNPKSIASLYSPSPAPVSPLPVEVPATLPASGTPVAITASPFPNAATDGSPRFDTTAPCMLRALPEDPVTMEVIASGEPPLSYQWETFDGAKGSATPIEGCTSATLTVALEASDSMLAFQCRVSNPPCPQGVVSRTFFLKKAPRPLPSGGSPPQQPTKLRGRERAIGGHS